MTIYGVIYLDGSSGTFLYDSHWSFESDAQRRVDELNKEDKYNCARIVGINVK